MAATFLQFDANTGAVTVSDATTELFRMNVVTYDVESDVFPWHWSRALARALRKLAMVTVLSERKTVDFASVLLSVVDADGGADSELSVAVDGDVVTVSLSSTVGAASLVSIQRRGGVVKAAGAPAAPSSSGGSVNLAPYALKTELPNLTPYALKTELPAVPDLSGYALKTELPPAAVPGATFYVAKHGDDASGNGSVTKPVATITKGLELANTVASGYVRVNVGPGEYTENVTISRKRTILAGAGVDPEDHTTSIIGTLTVDCSSATQRYNDVVAVQGIYVNNGAKVTGTGAFMTVFTDCYLTTGVAANNAVLVDASHTDRPIVYLRNCSVTKQGSATTDVVKLAKGDVRMDTVRVYGAVSGTGNGILLSSNATLQADRLQVDISMQGAALRIDGSYAGVAATLSNTGLKSDYVGSGAAPALYIKNDTGVGAFLWQVMLMAKDTAAGKYAIDGVYNGGALTSPLIYSNVTFGPGTCTALGAQVSAAKFKMTDLA